MPLKLICCDCGELMYQTTGRPNKTYKTNRYYSNLLDLSVPDIVDLKLKFKCPSCKRTISSEDLEAMTVDVSPFKEKVNA